MCPGGAVPWGSWGRRCSSTVGRQWVPLPGQWVPLGHRGIAGGAPRPLSLCPPGRYLRLRPRGFLRPLPGGPALPAAAAPLLQRQPAPAAPGRLPLAPPATPPALFTFKLHLHPPPPSAGAGGTSPPSLRGPLRCRLALPAGRSQRRVGVRAGAPRQSGDRVGAPVPCPPSRSDWESGVGALRPRPPHPPHLFF